MAIPCGEQEQSVRKCQGRCMYLHWRYSHVLQYCHGRNTAKWHQHHCIRRFWQQHPQQQTSHGLTALVPMQCTPDHPSRCTWAKQHATSSTTALVVNTNILLTSTTLSTTTRNVPFALCDTGDTTRMCEEKRPAERLKDDEGYDIDLCRDHYLDVS